MNKKALQYILKAAILVPLFYFFPYVMVPYLVCGIYDVVRNRKLDIGVVAQYFLGNGLFTWFLSPLNILLDLLSIPNINKGIYKLEDLPKSHQDEIMRLIEASKKENLAEVLTEKTKGIPRSMFFFKWYGKNQDTAFEVPAFHEDYKYIKTIGISCFNTKESTSRHFGPLRASLRVLYNINQMDDHSAFIEVGDVKHYWIEEKLFIFDDTLLHQSFNQSDKARYNLFVDIIRPSPLSGVLNLFISGIRFFMQGVNNVFYKNWKVVKN